MLLMTLKGIKRMLDKVREDQLSNLDGTNPPEVHASVVKVIANVSNARDMLEELIKELEKKPKTVTYEPTPEGGELSPEARTAKEEVLGT